MGQLDVLPAGAVGEVVAGIGDDSVVEIDVDSWGPGVGSSKVRVVEMAVEEGANGDDTVVDTVGMELEGVLGDPEHAGGKSGSP